jgi:hypothetical protein
MYEAVKFEHYVCLFSRRFGVAHHWRLVVCQLEQATVQDRPMRMRCFGLDITLV